MQYASETYVSLAFFMQLIIMRLMRLQKIN